MFIKINLVKKLNIKVIFHQLVFVESNIRRSYIVRTPHGCDIYNKAFFFIQHIQIHIHVGIHYIQIHPFLVKTFVRN